MVYRPLPIMTADDGSTRRQSRMYKLLVVAILIGFVICGYYLHSLLSENEHLKAKQRNLSYQLGKYASGYAKCERNLKTSKADVLNFQESNKQLHAQNQEKENRIADAAQVNAGCSLKLDQAYQFFLDVKDILKGDMTISEDHTILPEAADVLKTEIQQLQTARLALDKLKQTHDDTSTQLSETRTKLNEVTAHNGELQDHAKGLYNNNKKLKRDLAVKQQNLDQASIQITNLQGTIDKLQDDLQKLAKKREEERKIHEDEKNVLRFSVPTRVPTVKKVDVVPPVEKDAVAAPVEKDAVAAPVEKDAVAAPVEKDAAVAPVEENTTVGDVKTGDEELDILDNEQKVVVASKAPILEQSDNTETERRVVEDSPTVEKTKVEEPTLTTPSHDIPQSTNTLSENPSDTFDSEPANNPKDVVDKPKDSKEKLDVAPDWKVDEEEEDEDEAAADDGVDDMDETRKEK